MQSCKSDLLLVALLIMTHPLHLVHCIKVKACIARFTITLIGYQHDQVHQSDHFKSGREPGLVRNGKNRSQNYILCACTMVILQRES